ncbi:neutral/alkaline non-lysosomal ceramidase N-terminal domain-containing protein [Paenibacillus contaminans]|nr:neutral/alkaline non-lysosomal ceramidase N-terminal domain-containing protein [Paenibacillus contaminans]
MTPERPVFMHGFGGRTQKSEGVHDELYVKAAMLEANKTLLILTIDALGSDRSFVVGIKDALQEKFGLGHDEVLINFSHTHHSVFLTGLDAGLRRGAYSMAQEGWTDSETQLDYSEDEAFFRFMRDTILQMTAYCRDHLEEGELAIGRGKSDFAVSRRKPDGDGVIWAPYYEGEIDKELLVVTLTDRSGMVKGILYNYGCHTTAMGPDNMLLSNDFAGQTSCVLEESYPGATALFLQGCGGELKPLRSAAGSRFKSLSIAEMIDSGTELANDVKAILKQGELTPVRCNFKTALADPLLYTEQTEAAFYEPMTNHPDYNAFYWNSAKRTMRAIEDGTIKDRLPHCICIWHLDDDTRLVAMEGEVSTEYSLLIKKLFGSSRTTLTLGYTNGVYSYVPTRKMIREGGYEAECNFFFHLRGPFVPEIEDIIVGQIVLTDMKLSNTM